MDFQKSFEATMLGNVSCSSAPSCRECQELLKELQLKDKIIHELREKLNSIQQICCSDTTLDLSSEHQEVLEDKIIKSFNTGNETLSHNSSRKPRLPTTFRTPPLSSDSESSVDGTKDDNAGFNLNLVKLEPSPTMTSIKLEIVDEEHQGSNSNSSFPPFVPPHHHQEKRNEVSKITVQEIIDKVVERSPKRDDSLKTRNVENICNSFNTLLSKLESQAERKERNESEPWNGSSEDQSNSSNEQTFVNRPPPTTTSGSGGSSSCMDLVLHTNSKRNLNSCCPTIPNTTTTTTSTTEFSSPKAKPNNSINEASNSSSFGLSDNSSRKRKSFATASSSEQPSSSSSSSPSSAALFPSSMNPNFHHPPPPPPPAVGHHHHHFVYYPKTIPTFPYYAPHQHQLGNMESNSSKPPSFLQCPKCLRSFSTQLILLVHMKDCCQDVNVMPTGTSTPAFNFAVCCSTNNTNGIGGGGGVVVEPLPDQIPKAVLNRIPVGTDISMVYNLHNNSNHTSAGGGGGGGTKSNNSRKY